MKNLLPYSILSTLLSLWLIFANLRQAAENRGLRHSLELRDELIAAREAGEAADIKLGMEVAIVQTKRFLLDESKGLYDYLPLEDRRCLLRVLISNEYNRLNPARPPIFLILPPDGMPNL